MKSEGVGGHNTITGLHFEAKVDLHQLLEKIPGYSLEKLPGKAGTDVYFNNNLVARLFRKYSFYDFLSEKGINWRQIISKRLLPDGAVLVIIRDTLFIIEVKFQHVAGSVDEKLQTCDFKRKQYIKLVGPLGLKVEYVYILSDWFKKPEYKDVLDYIRSVNCEYLFETIPLKWLGLPTTEDNKGENIY